MTPEDEKELMERLALIGSMVKATELALDGARRTGDLKSTREFAEHLHNASGIFLEVVDAVLEFK